jgi:hypothetical protein
MLHDGLLFVVGCQNCGVAVVVVDLGIRSAKSSFAHCRHRLHQQRRRAQPQSPSPSSSYWLLSA